MKLTEEQKELIEKEFLHPDDRTIIFDCIDDDDIYWMPVFFMSKIIELVPELKKLL